MSAILAFFLGHTSLAIAALGAIATVLGIGWGNLRGAKRERDKQAAGKLAAAEDRLEMDREATAAERAAAGMTDDQARKEAEPWVRR